ncbi:MAG: thioredoxin domain-containing protein [Nannocystaceae bacterium]
MKRTDADANLNNEANTSAKADSDPAARPLGRDFVAHALPGLGPRARSLHETLEKAFADKGPDYKPRTHHLIDGARPKFINRLILETSPYLLQHAHNPVNWYAWGDEPFDRARREKKAVLLSIGYSTCHWCHVMERESFEDLEIAAYLNEHYVCIKVDREERPDVDDVYMKAVHLLAGRGGWPMTTVLTPAREPFFGGTYFPPRDGARGRRKGFLTIIKDLRAKYIESPDELVEQAMQLSRQIADSAGIEPPEPVPGPGAIKSTVERISARYDPAWGGFSAAPKFPRPVNFRLLLRYARRSGSAEPTKKVADTLLKMAQGGLHDQLGGGFHRYSTDARWLVPHFEKMLYDNAQLVVAYIEAHQVTGNQVFADVATTTLDYLAREMSDPDGGFYSATDADSLNPETQHEDEGWFFTWTRAEIEAVVGADLARVVNAYYATTARGNFEHRNILHTPEAASLVASKLKMKPADLARDLSVARKKMYASRATRPPPLRDDKILSSWNGLAISAFATAGFVLDRPDYIERAEKSADFLLTQMRTPNGGLYRTFNDGRARHMAYLDDYAFLIAGLLDVHEASNNQKWLREAIALQGVLNRKYHDESSGGFFLTSHDAEPLLARQKPDYDGAEPSGNSVAALNLLRLSELTGDDDHRSRAEKLLGAQGRVLRRGGVTVPLLMSALDFYFDRPLQIFVVYPKGGNPSPLVDVIRSSFLPNRILSVVSEDKIAEHVQLVPGLSDKRALKGRPTAYVCEQNVCQLPTRDPKVLAKQLAKTTPYPSP